MHLVSAKTSLTPYYVFPEFQNSYTEVFSKYSNKLIHQIYSIKLLKHWLTEHILHQIYTG